MDDVPGRPRAASNDAGVFRHLTDALARSADDLRHNRVEDARAAPAKLNAGLMATSPASGPHPQRAERPSLWSAKLAPPRRRLRLYSSTSSHVISTGAYSDGSQPGIPTQASR